MVNMPFANNSVKRKILGYVTISTVISIFGAILFAQTILKYQFKNLAHNEIRQKIEMVCKLIDSETERLVQINADWGAWDETYQFVQDKNEAYKKNNLIPSSFVTLGIRILIYFDRKGNVVYAGEYYPEKDTILPLDSQTCQTIYNALFNQGLREHLIKGVVTIFKNEPFIISAGSILTSQHKGPLMGWLIMGRQLNFKPIMELTELIIDMKYDDSTQICILDKKEHILNINMKSDSIYASDKFYDVLTQRLLSINVVEENKIAKQGNRTGLYILLSIVIFWFFIVFLLLRGLDYIVIQPLFRISRQLKNIDLNNIETKIELPKSKDEIFFLATELNDMLDIIKKQKMEIVESENRYRDLVENAEVGILIDDVAGNVVYFNDKLAHLFGYTSEEFTKLSIEDYIHPESLKVIRMYHRQRIKGEDSPKIYEIKGIHKKGNIVNLEVNTLILKKDNQVVGTRNYIVDITERKKIEEKLSIESITDDLTQVFNRRGFFSFGEQQVNLSKKTGKGFYIFYCDLNDMKKLNDRFGHSTGDIILKQVANILKNSFRKSDIIARVGGDEFIVLASEAQPESVDVMLKRLKSNIEKFNETEQYPPISLSVGYAYFYPDDSKTLNDIINIADRMMYEEKQKFKNQK